MSSVRCLSQHLCTATLAVVLLAAAPQAALAGKSHLGQKPVDHVTLVWATLAGADDCAPSGKGLAELGADGIVASEPFVVPAGYALVVTDVEWQSTGSFSQGSWLNFALYFTNSPYNRVFERTQVIDANVAAYNHWSDSDTMATGFRVAAGAVLCPASGVESTGGFYTTTVRDVTLRGYLIRSK